MDPKASSILSKLQGYDCAGIDKLFSDYLHPVSLLPKKPEPEPDPCSIRSLAMTFSPCLCDSLRFFPDRLCESPRHPNTERFTAQLIEAYELCLDCLEAISSQLSAKPYAVHLQRDRFIRFFLHWGWYDDTIDEGNRVLKSLGGIALGSQCQVTMGELVPPVVLPESADAMHLEFAHLIVDIVAAITTSVPISETEDVPKYTALLILVSEVRPLFRCLDACESNKLRLRQLACVKDAMRFFVSEAVHFEGDLIPEFLKATLDEYIQLLNSLNPQDIMGKELEEFVEFVSDNAKRCLSASKSVRVAVAMHLHWSAPSFSKDLAYFILIQRLYAIGLHLSESSLHPNDCCSPDSRGPTCISSVGMLPECWHKLEHLSALLASGKKYYCFNLSDYDQSLRCKCGDFIEEVSPYCKCDQKAFKSCMSENGANYLLYYLNALKFLCRPLAEFVDSQMKSIVDAKGDSALGNALTPIHEAVLEYCYLFPHCWR